MLFVQPLSGRACLNTRFRMALEISVNTTPIEKNIVVRSRLNIIVVTRATGMRTGIMLIQAIKKPKRSPRFL